MNKTVVLILSLFFGLTAFNQNFYWVKNVPGKSFVDAEGNTYKTGGFEGTYDFNPGEDEYNLMGLSDGDGAYAMKLDPFGNLLWAYAFESEMWTRGTSIIANSLGEVFIWGSYKHFMDADPSDGVFTLDNEGYRDCFLIKLKAGGEFEWAKNIGGWAYLFSNDMALDNDENIILTGAFDLEIDCDPGPGYYSLTHISNAGDEDNFTIKLDPNGNFITATNIGYFGIYDSPKLECLTTDIENNIYIGGRYQGDINFDPWGGDHFGATVGEKNGFIYKQDELLNFEWLKTILGNSEISTSEITEIVVDNEGNLYASGFFTDSAHFETEDEAIGSKGLEDAFIIKLNATDGSTMWTKTFGNTGDDRATSICIEPTGNLSVLGEFSGTVDFDFGAEVFEMTANGINDLFILNLTPEGDFNWAKQIGNEFVETASDFISTDSYGNTYFAGKVNGSVDFDPNDGETYMLGTETFSKPPLPFLTKLAPCEIYKGDTMVVHACDAYLWEETGDLYNTTGIFGAIYENGFGCDSVLFLDLDFESYGPPISVVSCGPYTVPSGDETYMYSGDYTDTLFNALGCDSIFEIDLTILPALDISTNQDGIILTANLDGAIYQWVDCNADYAPIGGETNQDFIVPTNGSYAVIISNGECTDTSDCINFLHFSIDENTQNQLQLYPNPSTGEFNVLFANNSSAVVINIYTINDQLVYTKSFENQENITLNYKGAKGIYLLELKTDSGAVYYTKFIKQ